MTGSPADRGNFAGLRILAFESRRAAEMAELIRRRGGEPIVAPALREVPLSENTPAFEFVRRLEAAGCDLVILMTGTALRTLLETVRPEWPPERVARALRRTVLVCRGPKSAAVLRELQLQPAMIAPEPNTWREILTTLDARLPVAGQRIAVLEYGAPNPEFVAGLEVRGAEVARVPVYRWTLPEDLGPLRAAIERICAGDADILLFTSATQVQHLFEVAGGGGVSDRLRAACDSMLIASIGPVCSEALREHGLVPDLEPGHAKMGHLVAEAAQQGPALLEVKRRRRG